MKRVKNILKPSIDHYSAIQKKLEKKLTGIPKGNIKVRVIGGKNYYYLQKRVGSRVLQRYLGKKPSAKISKSIKKRLKIERELKQTREILALLRSARIGSAIIMKYKSGPSSGI